MLCNLIEIALRHGCSRVNLLYIFRTPLPKDGCFCIAVVVVLVTPVGLFMTGYSIVLENIVNNSLIMNIMTDRSSRQEVFLGKSVLKNMHQIFRRTPKLQSNFIEITLRYGVLL